MIFSARLPKLKYSPHGGSAYRLKSSLLAMIQVLVDNRASGQGANNVRHTCSKFVTTLKCKGASTIG